MIQISCTNCDWWDERTVKSIPVCCPECHQSIERATDAENPDQTKTDKV